MSDPTQYVWTVVRDEYVVKWADTPHGETEQRIIDVFLKHPQLVVDAAKQIDSRYTRGVVRSPWAVLVKQVEEASTRSAQASVPVRGEHDRQKVITRGSQWMRAAGMQFDSESELRDELFGERGMLRAWAEDAELVDELVALWHVVRATGEQLELEAIERGQVDAAAKRALREPKREPVAATGNPFIDEDDG
jgi:hypothetical protein